MKLLTDLQKKTLAELRNHDHHFIAGDAEDFWKCGKAWYIDDRVRVPAWLRKQFDQCNEIATKRIFR